MFQFIDFSWSEYTVSLWIDEPFRGLCWLCLPFVPLCATIHSISLSLLHLFSAATSLFLSLFPSSICQPSVSWPESRRETGSGRGLSFDTGFKHSGMGVVPRVKVVDGGGCVCVCFKGAGGYVEAVGKHCIGQCSCWGLPPLGVGGE